MPSRPLSLTAATAISGAAGLIAMVLLAVSRAPLGSPAFFALTAAFVAIYAGMLVRTRRADRSEGRAFPLAMLFAVLFRLPLAVAPVDGHNDMVRYLWDGRAQQRGYNPYSILPSDPAAAAIHTPESAGMPSLRARTPYPPAAQLFFRLVVGVRDSTRGMKFALLACDLLTIAVVWRWLIAGGHSKWLTLAYAWNPLVVIEVAHSGHIDALATLWLVVAAYWLTRARTALATVAFVLAVTTKLLPIVLLPLFIGRVRLRDAVLGVALLALMYLQFYDSRVPVLGAVPNVVAYVRFNGPVFLGVASVTSARMAAAVALLAGLAAAVVTRWRLPISDPAAWAWPVAIALVCAPVVYPWYLLPLTPFLWTRATLPLLAWCFSSLSVYAVWEGARHGGRWTVPPLIQAFELLVPVTVALLLRLSKAAPELDGRPAIPSRR